MNRVFVVFVLVLFLSSGIVYGDDIPVAAISTGVEIDRLDENIRRNEIDVLSDIIEYGACLACHKWRHDL